MTMHNDLRPRQTEQSSPAEMETIRSLIDQVCTPGILPAEMEQKDEATRGLSLLGAAAINEMTRQIEQTFNKQELNRMAHLATALGELAVDREGQSPETERAFEQAKEVLTVVKNTLAVKNFGLLSADEEMALAAANSCHEDLESGKAAAVPS